VSARAAVSHLLTGGYRRLACITGPVTSTTGYKRLGVYHKALKEAGVALDDSLVRGRLPATRWSAGHARAVGPVPTPRRGVRDQTLMKICVLQASAQGKLAVPADIAVVSFLPI
jgi:LacI family transcriptional regulator